MRHIIRFYPLDRVDIGIGVSKDIEVVYGDSWEETTGNKILLPGHPLPKAVTFELLKKDLMRVTNNSENVVSLWPGTEFLRIAPRHPMYKLLFAEPLIRTTEFVGHVTDMTLEVSIDTLELPSSITEALEVAGYSTIESLEEAVDEELEAVLGIGPASLTKIHNAIIKYRKNREATADGHN